MTEIWCEVPGFRSVQLHLSCYGLLLQPPGFSIGRHVFLSGILSVLSGGTVNLLTLVTMNIIFILIPGFDIYIDFSYLWMRP